MAKKKQSGENYLEKIPTLADKFRWTADENGIVTVEIDNKGFFNRIFNSYTVFFGCSCYRYKSLG